MIAAIVLRLAVGAGCAHLCPAIPAADPRLDQLRHALAGIYRSAGVCEPCEDPRLSDAAAHLVAGLGREAALPDPVAIQRHIQQAGAGDPSPRVFLVVAGSDDALVGALSARLTVDANDTVFGIAAAPGPEGPRAVVIRAERKVALEPLPKHVRPNATVELRGDILASSLQRAQLYVEAPDGSVAQVKTSVAERRFHGSFVPTAAGRYLIEVMAEGKRGPEVELISPIEVGEGADVEADEPGPTASDDAASVLEAINRERQRYGAATLAPDSRLAKVAQGYAEELRALGIFGHISPKSGGLEERLHRAGYAYQRAGENLAQGPSANTAHALAANSPAHRKAMLDPSFTRCGIGISRVINGDGRTDVLLVEVFALDRS